MAADEPSNRKDAQRSRAAIMQAARELFALRADVPMYEIAKRAGVGQATIHRHFPDRVDLAAAIAEESLDAVERVAAEHAGETDAFFLVLRTVVAEQVRAHGLMTVLRQRDGSRTTDQITARVLAIFRGPLEDAQSAGRVRADLVLEEILLLLAMVEGVLTETTDPATRGAAATRTLDLLLQGVA
jgi:AcrR family transcriptional regulator